MRKFYSIFIICLFAGTAFAQKNNKQEVITIPYDSTTNFLGKNAQQYAGQELYLKGLEKSSQQYGYTGFILKYKKEYPVI